MTRQVFLPPEIDAAIKQTPYRSTENIARDEKKVIARFFNPCGAGVWYVLEGTEEYSLPDELYEDNCGHVVYGACSITDYMELGCFSLAELQQLKLPHGLYIERDEAVLPFEHTLGELMKKHGEE